MLLIDKRGMVLYPCCWRDHSCPHGCVVHPLPCLMVLEVKCLSLVPIPPKMMITPSLIPLHGSDGSEHGQPGQLLAMAGEPQTCLTRPMRLIHAEPSWCTSTNGDASLIPCLHCVSWPRVLPYSTGVCFTVEIARRATNECRWSTGYPTGSYTQIHPTFYCLWPDSDSCTRLCSLSTDMKHFN